MGFAMKKIDIVIGGAQRSGTTSLSRYLNQHPCFCLHRNREFNVFLYEEKFNNNYEKFFAQDYLCQDLDRKIILAKSVWIMNLPEAIQRLHKHNPKIKIVLLLRNPVDRAYSAFWYARQRGLEEIGSFEEALYAGDDRLRNNFGKFLNCRYLETGAYIKHIKNLQNFFPRDQLHIYFFEEFVRYPETICRDIFSLFPGIDANFVPETTVKHNSIARNRSSLIARSLSLQEYLRRPKRILRQFIPQKFVFSLRNKLEDINETSFSPPSFPQRYARGCMNIMHFTTMN
jgi:hypothetical protein